MDESNPVVIDFDIMGGKPVFRGTRVPVETMVVYLVKDGFTLDEFLDDFPTVRREVALQVLRRLSQAIPVEAAR